MIIMNMQEESQKRRGRAEHGSGKGGYIIEKETLITTS